MVFKLGPRCPFSVCAALWHFDKCNTAGMAFSFFFLSTGLWWLTEGVHPDSQSSFSEPTSWRWGCPDSHIRGDFPTELPGRNKYQPADTWRGACGPWGRSVRSHPGESPVPWKQKEGLVRSALTTEKNTLLSVMPHVLEVFYTSVDNETPCIIDSAQLRYNYFKFSFVLFWGRVFYLLLLFMCFFLLLVYYKLIIGNYKTGTRLYSKGEKKIQVRNESSASMFLKMGQFEGVWLWATLGECGLESRQAHRPSLTQGLDSHQAEKGLHSGVLSDNSLLRRKECRTVWPGLAETDSWARRAHLTPFTLPELQLDGCVYVWSL